MEFCRIHQKQFKISQMALAASAASFAAVQIKGPIEPLEVGLLPFTGGPGSLLLLLKVLPSRMKIRLLYLRGLHEHNDESQQASICRLLPTLQDYWGDSLTSQRNLIVKEVPRHRLDPGAATTPIATVLFHHLAVAAEETKCTLIVLPDVLRSSDSLRSSRRIRWIDVPWDMRSQLDLVLRTLCDARHLMGRDVYPQDVLRWCRPCKMPSKYLPKPQLQQQRNRSVLESIPTEEQDRWSGVCGRSECGECLLFRRLLQNVEDADETYMEDGMDTFGEWPLLSTRKRKRCQF